MRITVTCIGRLKGAEQALCDRYSERINSGGRQVAFGPLEIRQLGENRGQTASARKEAEAGMLAAKIPDNAYIFCLDERGKDFTTAGFSQKIQGLRDDGIRDLAFVLGGADGLSGEILKNASGRISLGHMTMPHGLARVVLLEQLYRIMTLWAGHPYHRV